MSKYDMLLSHDLLSREEERELGLRALAGDVLAINRLLEHNLRLVVFLAEELRPEGCILSLDDLVSEGILGLTTAARRFNPDKGAKFSSYASWWIKQAIRSSIAENDGPIRVPSSTGRMRKPLRAFLARFSSENGRSPTTDEILEHFPNISRNRILALLDINSLIRLDAPLLQGETGDVGSLIEDESSVSPLAVLIRNENLGEVQRLMECLTDRDRFIIKLRFGLDGKGVRTLEEIKKVIGLTRERVRQIQNKALSKMRNFLIKEL